MPENEATFEFPKFRVQVRYLGEEDGPAYQTRIEAPGFEPVDSGGVLKQLPLFSSAARAAVSEIRELLEEGVKAFLEDFRKNSGVFSLKAVQDMRLLFLSWHDVGSAIGEEALAAADAELKAQELVESREAYGKEQKEEDPAADEVYDLGTVLMYVRVMGHAENFPIFGITAKVPGTDLHANTIIALKSPLIAHAVQEMVLNLTSVLNQGVERYLAEDPRAQLSRMTAEKTAGTEMLYAVASQIGSEGLKVALMNTDELLEKERGAFEDEAIVYMENVIAERKKRMEKK